MTDTSSSPASSRQVKGSVIVDYLKIMRANPDLPWGNHLSPPELQALDQMILPASWYPAELFQRLGVAIFKLVSREKYEVVRLFGRGMAEKMAGENPGLVVAGQPRDTLKKFMAIQARLYSPRLVEEAEAGAGRVVILVNTRREDTGCRLLVEATAGTAKRLAELAGGREVKSELLTAVWDGADTNRLQVTWKEGG